MAARHINPIIPGFAPDPSLCVADGTFFLVNSTFHLFPGLPVYASKNLTEWKLIGNAVNRHGQLSLADTRTNIHELATGGNIVGTGGLYAPTIRYNNGTFYILCTIVTHRDPPAKSHSFANFILKTNDIYSGNWSDPIYFDFYAFDPSLFFDDDGRAYVHGAAMPGPETTIDIFEVDLKTGKKLTEQTTIWTGITKFFPEGPHIYKKDGYYYCLIAEDGTHEFHAVKIARSKTLMGPYESFEKNPLLSAAPGDYYQHIGHAELFQDPTGEWWCVCLGVRKTAKGHFVLSRETFLTQASWPEGDWPSIEPIKPNPERLAGQAKPQLLGGADEDELLFIREPGLRGYKRDGDTIMLKPSTLDFTYAVGTEPISFVGRRQRRLDGVASVKLLSGVQGADLKAGLAYFKDEHRFIRLFYDFSTSELCFDAVNASQKFAESSKRSLELVQGVELRVTYTELEYTCSFRPKGSEDWTQMATVDGLKMSDFDFVGPVIGVFAFGSASDTQVQFKGLQVD
ncbi:uncharacterized protein HMPREF1541_07233 [Cyphellophora europaea CBS 101466]|uniref:Beta-xylosidase C-terminal Concanavalin A-like domain-containing protein n=1 Tax=Cyphellophora europaea (strain CBS 101466) TaxID=1220924 RepID=W2RM64_CYPE1|nr:uncharacterized protein HMPREF1541_07233 [Cyphellophora europaea CBS 101466]ETN37611.1 hypothetical protein HMPREF1541_07233 [Cyphellophora europaea CBS 101466]